jgi:branched-chain amino acid transport system substrate-binding protein
MIVSGYIIFKKPNLEDVPVVNQSGLIKIAVIRSNQDGLAHYGEMFLHGVQLMLEQVNENGGIKGRPLDVTIFDDPCSQEADGIMRKISSDDTIAVAIGPMCTSSAIALQPVFQRRSLPAILPTATSPFINHRGWMFRNVYDDDFQARSIALYAQRILNVKRVAILHQDGTFGVRMKDCFSEQATQVGLDVVVVKPYPVGCTDFAKDLQLIREKEPQVIFLAAYYEEGAMIAHQAKKMKLNIQFLAPDTMFHPGLIEMGGDAVEGFLICSACGGLLDLENSRIKSFLDQFVDRFHEIPNWIAVNAYDAAGILTEAIKNVGAERSAIRDYLAQLDSPEKAYRGISGPVYFDKNGNCIKPVQIATVEGGRFKSAPKQLSEIPQ